jgi:argininosuccinate lyase
LSAALRDASERELGRAIDIDEPTLARILSPRYFVEVRTTPGGPAPSVSARAIEQAESQLRSDLEWRRTAEDCLRAAQEALRTAVAQL